MAIEVDLFQFDEHLLHSQSEDNFDTLERYNTPTTMAIEVALFQFDEHLQKTPRILSVEQVVLEISNY
jgi:hypothetical protein